MNPLGLVFIAAGVFAICGAAFNWDWFMLGRKALFLVQVLGRQGARVFYGVIGVVIIVLGTLVLLGVIENRS